MKEYRYVKNKVLFYFLLILSLNPLDSFAQKTAKVQKPRVYVLTDISSLKGGEGEPDDTQSLIRFLLYANKFCIEGISATYTSHGKNIYPEYIPEVINAYGKSFQNLKKHGDFPCPKYLLQKAGKGSVKIGVENLGAGNDSKASEDIISLLKKNHKEPLWVLVWGSPSDLAQALWKMRSTMSEKKVQELTSSLRVFAISDQYDKTGQWIRSNFRNLFYIVSNVSFRGMYRGGNEDLCSGDWVRNNILSNPQALAQLYPNYSGRDPWGKVEGIKEGDTPSFLYLLSGNPNEPTGEHWGGSFHKLEGTNHFTDGTKKDFPKYTDTVYKWRQDFQNDFVKRLLWLSQ